MEHKRTESSTAKLPDFSLVRVIYGQRVAMAVRFIRVVPNQDLGLQISSGDLVKQGFSGDAEFQVISRGEYTRLVFNSHTKFVSLRDQIFEPVWTYAAKYKMRDDLAKLKVLLEAEPANSSNSRAAALGN